MYPCASTKSDPYIGPPLVRVVTQCHGVFWNPARFGPSIHTHTWWKQRLEKQHALNTRLNSNSPTRSSAGMTNHTFALFTTQQDSYAKNIWNMLLSFSVKLLVWGKMCKQKHVSTLHCFGHISSMNNRNSINVAPNDTHCLRGEKWHLKLSDFVFLLTKFSSCQQLHWKGQ